MSCRIFRPLLIILVLSAIAFSQTTGTATTYKLLSIEVKGLQRLTPESVIAASGLKLGQIAGDADFQQAAQKLGGTGLFAQLTYSYQYSAAGCELEFQVAENQKLVPIVFENFVWFSDEELLRILRAQVPLFEGQVPINGNLTEQLAQALTSILKQRNIPGVVEYLPFSSADGPIEAYEYKVTFHSIVIRNVDFTGADADELAALQNAAKPLSGADYLRTDIRAQERFDFLPVYESRGYLKAQFGDAQAKVIEDGPRTTVDLSIPVTAGIQYKVQSFEIAGNRAFPAEQLRQLVQLKSGEPANAVELAADLEQIHKLYGTKGYLFAHVESIPAMDDSKATVAYQLNVNEGDVYRMGDLSIDGIPEENAAKIAAQWQMKKGDPFDESYPQRFFKILYRDFGLHRSYEVAQKQAINREDKTVSISLHFVPRT